MSLLSDVESPVSRHSLREAALAGARFHSPEDNKGQNFAVLSPPVAAIRNRLRAVGREYEVLALIFAVKLSTTGSRRSLFPVFAK